MKFEYLEDQSEPLIGAVPLTPASTSDLLTHIANNSSDHQVVFDLDSTLLDNRPRNARIMREFGESQNEPVLQAALPEHFTDWSAANSMTTIGLDSVRIEQLLPLYESFWVKRFFTSEYCRFDIAVAGAEEFVNTLLDAGTQVTYLTGRHDAMRAGTIDSLTALGFPEPSNEVSPDDTRLITKPVFEQSDDTYKINAIEQLRPGRRVYAAFDNEPSHINTYRSLFPDAICVHLLTDHSMKKVRLFENIYSVKNFLI